MAIYISKQTGLWSTASTWLTALPAATFSNSVFALSAQGNAGQPPQSGAGDKIIIGNGATVTYDVLGEFGDDGSFNTAAGATGPFLWSNAISISGVSTLKASRTVNTSLSARGSIYVGGAGGINNWIGGLFDWGTESDPVSAVTSEIVFGTYSSTFTTLSGRGGRCMLHAASQTNAMATVPVTTLTICGKSKTRNTALSGNHVTGSSTLTATDVKNWEMGDKLYFEPHSFVSNTNITAASATITSINGNVIGITPTLASNYSSGTYVGNFTSNITLRPAFTTSNSSPFGGIYIQPNQHPSSLYLIKNCTIKDTFTGGFDNSTGNPTGTYGALATWAGTPIIPVVYDNVAIDYTALQVQSLHIFSLLNQSTQSHQFKNLAIYGSVVASGNPGSVVFSRLGSAYNFENSVVYKYNTSFTPDQTYTASATIKNCRVNTSYRPINGNGYSWSFNNCYFRNFDGFVYITNGIGTMTIDNCTIIGTNNSGYRLIDTVYGTFGTYTFTNCTLSGILIPAQPLNTTASTFSRPSMSVKLNTLNSNPLDNRRFNSFYTLSSDYTNRNRGIASYKVQGCAANNQYYFTETTDGFAGSTKRFIGYIKYDAIYGTATLPYITFTDSTQTATQTFSCSPTPNVWQKFDLSLTPSSNGLITMTFTGQTSAITANAYLDGLPFYPITPKARHYGFNFDEAIPNRTIDTLTTLTENQVSAISTVNNLDYLYDSSNYWSVTNPSLTAYTDLYTRDGNILDFGSRNIVVNNSASTGFAYASASSTLTIKTPLLSSGNNFIGLRTTGNIYLSSGSTIGEIDIYGNVFQATPVSLSGIYMEGTLAYNTNSPITIEYTDCTMDTVQNDGSAFVTIKKTNSTIANGLDAEIADFVPTILNVDLDGGYIAIYDNNATRQYYQNTDGAIVLPSSATGNWTYRIARYGYQYIQGSFTVDSNTGANITIAPNYTPDNFVTSNTTAVAAYTNLETTEKIYNYLNYWSTTTSGIDYTPFYSKAFGSITINKNVNLDATAASILTYNGSTELTLKCTGLVEDELFVSTGNVVAQNGTTYSDDVKIRAANLNSEFILGGITSMTLFPTENDRDDNTNDGDTLTGTIYRFLYGGVVNGVTLSGTIYARVDVAGTVLLYSDAITTGRNELEFGTTGTLQQIINNQKVINEGVQKASILVPHTTDI